MKAYVSAFRIRLLQGMQYRVAALAGIATQFFWGFMLIMVYGAFLKGSPSASPMTVAQTASYVWLHQAFLALVMFWIRDSELFNLITNGNVAYELCRPVGLYAFWFAKLLAGRLAAAALRCFPILLVSLLLPAPYGLQLPPSIPAFLVFLGSMTLGVLILVAICQFIYLATFLTLNPTGPLVAIGGLGEFCNGGIIPLPMLPDGIRQIINWLPFRLTADIPFRIWSGHIPVQEALWIIPQQLLWLFLLTGTGVWAMHRIQSRIVVQGG